MGVFEGFTIDDDDNQRSRIQGAWIGSLITFTKPYKGRSVEYTGFLEKTRDGSIIAGNYKSGQNVNEFTMMKPADNRIMSSEMVEDISLNCSIDATDLESVKASWSINGEEIDLNSALCNGNCIKKELKNGQI